MNQATVMGRLTHDPELKTTKSGVSVSSNTIAVNRRQKDSEGNYIVDFIDFTVWKGTAEYLCNYVKKGDTVILSGEIHQEKYEDRNGNQRSKYEIVGQSIELCKSKNEN